MILDKYFLDQKHSALRLLFRLTEVFAAHTRCALPTHTLICFIATSLRELAEMRLVYQPVYALHIRFNLNRG